MSRTADGGTCLGRISEQAATAAGGVAASVLGLELGAQAAALLAALDRADAGADPPDRGYLVTIRRAVFRSPVVPVGVALHATVAMVGRAGPLTMVEIAVATAAEPAVVIVEAVLGLFVEEPAARAQG